MVGDGSWSSRQQAFLAMERKYDLFALRVDGWSAWRVMRNFVFRKLENMPLAQPGRPTAVRSAEALVATLRLVWLLFKGEQRKLLVKTCRSGLRVRSGGQFRDVYFDGLLAEGCSYLKMEEINSAGFDKQAASAARPAGLDPVVFTFWGRILGMLMPARADTICQSIADILRSELGLELAPGVLRMRISTVYWQARLYRWLLARIKPQAILVSDTGEYGLRIAAGRQNIPFIELQHGIFDSKHPDAVPAWVDGPAAALILPDALASRGRYWVECLAETRQGRDHAVPVGNEFIDEARLRRNAHTRARTLHLVLTTQGLDSKQLAQWIEAMTRAAPASIDWRLSIKLHPIYDQENRDFSELQKDSRVRVIGGSDLPNVFDLLSEADLHMSISSACHFDAAALGVRSVIIPLGDHEWLLHAVDGEQILLAQSPDAIWHFAALPETSAVERAYRFSEPNFVANMQKLVARLTEPRSPPGARSAARSWDDASRMSKITTIATLQLSQASHSVPGSLPRRHYAMLAYVCLSLSMTMLVQQTASIERGSWQYFAYLAVAIGLPLLSWPAIIRCLTSRCLLLLVWLLLSGVWSFWTGDDRAIAQLVLLVLAMSWVVTDRARLDAGDLAKIYVGLILIGIGILLFTTLNPYSLIPGKAIPAYGAWRVSFFPNIAYSGILSLALLMVLTRDARLARTYPLLIIVASYFLVFSFVRAALLSAFIYFALRWWFGRWQVPQPRRMFWAAISVAFGLVALTAVSVQILYSIQDYPLVSVIMLRGMHDLTVDQISYQLYRPWLWSQQLNLFLSSPWLMGLGSADFHGLLASQEKFQALLISAGSEALPTRLLVAYGLPGLLFLVYLVQRLRQLALADDRWACACFPALFCLMMNWGSVFHPSDALFVILLLIMTKGSEGFTSREESSAHERKVGVSPIATQAQ